MAGEVSFSEEKKGLEEEGTVSRGKVPSRIFGQYKGSRGQITRHAAIQRGKGES